MSCPTSFDSECLPKAIMECHARRRPTVCAAQGTFEYATPDVIRPCVQSKGDDSMHAQRCPSVLLSKGDDYMPRPTSFDRLCFPRAMMA